MPLMPRVTILPFAFSEGTDVLAAPANLVVPGNWNVNGAWKTCIQPDIETPSDRGPFFLDRDNVLLEAYRVVTPFADGLVVVQPRIEFRVFGMHGAYPAVDNFSEENLFLDYSAPWGEWMEVNRFIPSWNSSDPLTPYNNKFLAIKTYPVTLRTATLDPAYNGEIVKLEIHLKLRHIYPAQNGVS